MLRRAGRGTLPGWEARQDFVKEEASEFHEDFRMWEGGKEEPWVWGKSRNEGQGREMEDWVPEQQGGLPGDWGCGMEARGQKEIGSSLWRALPGSGGDPELQAVEAFWQEDDVIRCVSESASTGNRKEETESERVGKIQPSGRGDQWDVWGKEGGGGKMAPPCPTGGTERIVGGQQNSGLYTREYTFHSQHTPYLNDT